MFVPSRTVDVAKTHAKSTMPSDVLKKQLADAMESGMATDSQLNSIINQMSPLPRFLNKLTYKRKVERYREIADLIEAQTAASKERTKLAKAALELERARRDEQG